MHTTCCAWPPTTSTRACAAWGPRKRLEIHNLGLGIEALDADLVFLQEVRLFHTTRGARFDRTWFGWPDEGQAEFLAPEGYEVAYRTNAITRHGEHGNALLSRWPIGDIGHHDVSDHRFEQRGLLHVPVQVAGRDDVHAVVAHLGLIHASRVRQVQRLADFIAAEVPAGEPLVVAGDFNDWGERARRTRCAEIGLGAPAPVGDRARAPPFRRACRCSRSTASTRAAWHCRSTHGAARQRAGPLVAHVRPPAAGGGAWPDDGPAAPRRLLPVERGPLTGGNEVAGC
jgi:endonuclease/exonuclease/phosphatase family metal-dependent hydrolase